MPRRLRQHVNPFALDSLVAREPVILPTRGPVEVDLGCGDGLFTVGRAAADPQTTFIGLDIRAEFLRPGQQRIAALGLSNARLETCNLIVDAGHLFAPGRIRRFFVNFPDPFFKRRQHHRRWLDAAALEALVDALEPSGEIVYQSDVWAPAIEALGLLELHPALENTLGELRFQRARLVPQWTSRERACLLEGRRIWRMCYVKQRSVVG